MLVTREFISQTHSFSSGSVSALLPSRVLLGAILISLKRILIEEGISKVILESLERMPFGNQRSHFFIFINVFNHLMKSGRDDGFAVNPRSSQQQVVRGVGVNDITCYLGSQVPNLTPEFDFLHRAHTISVEAIDACLSGA